MERYHLSDAATLLFGNWNCGGLSKLKKNLVCDLDYDIVCLTETHGWRDSDPCAIYSDTPSKRDPWSGVALQLSRRLSKYVIRHDFVGSRIVYCRLRGLTCNYFVIGIYIPQKQRKCPDQDDTYNQLEALLSTIGHRDCIILMGDFNSRLARDTPKRVGHWSIHVRSDNGGDRLLDIMNRFELRCVSTYFQPRRKHTNATYMNKQPGKAPSQIDHIIVSSRWATSARSCEPKWGLPIQTYGRKYDHAMVKMKFRLKLKSVTGSQRKNFTALKCQQIAEPHNDHIKQQLANSDRPDNISDQWKRLIEAMNSAQSLIPNVTRTAKRGWNTSDTTKSLLKERSERWDKLSADQRRHLKRQISHSARQDFRDYVDSLLGDIEQAVAVGNIKEVFRITKSLSNKRNGNKFIQPSKDLLGNQIVDDAQQLDSWATFLDSKFAAGPNEQEVMLDDNDEPEIIPSISLDEVKACRDKLKSGKACGPDSTPIEQFKASDAATEELHHVLSSIFDNESIPDNFVLADMLMHYKKKDKDNRGNYRALGLLNHGYKVFAMILLARISPYIMPKLLDTQAGFRKERGCRDNILILVTAIDHLLKNAADDARSCGIITYIDYTAAFDSIYHSYLLNALKSYGVPLKYCRLVRAIYRSAEIRVRLQDRSGNRSYSRNVSVSRGAIQGDIPSPVCFLVSLDKLLREHGGIDTGIQITDDLLLSDLEFADDASLPNEDTVTASNRLTHLNEKSTEEAGMSVSIPKTKAQHIRKRPEVSATTETDIENLPPDKQFKFKCDKCPMSYPTKHGLSVHQGRWCKKRKNAKKASRKGTVADRIITRVKVDAAQSNYDKVSIGAEELENVYAFVYLGAAIAGDGDPRVTLKHRTDIAWGCFNEYRKTLTSTKLPIPVRIKLYRSLVVQSLIYGSEAWFLKDDIRKSINGVNSKFLSQITKNSIHAEARHPSFSVVNNILKRRWEYLGHILRMENYRTLRRFLLELAPREAPFTDGSLLADTNFRSQDEMIETARDRKKWKEERKTRQMIAE